MAAPVQIPWPVSALPGRRPGEGSGDLVNAFAHKEGEEIVIERVAGLKTFTTLPNPTGRLPRGMLAIPGALVHVWDEEVRVTRDDGTEASATGSVLAGSDIVTLAHNLRQPTPDVVITSALGTYILDPATMVLSAYPDGDLGAVTSVEYYAGYFFFTRETGDIVASGLQSTAIDPLSIARAEYSSDYLLRVINNGSTFLALGDKTIEVWTDVGSSPFPAQRSTAIDVGLLGRYAVAGGANQWEHGVMFAASDYTVRVVRGYDAQIVSNEAVSRSLEDYRERTDEIVAQVYGFGPWSIFSLTTPDWTWEYCINTGSWHRRKSYGLKHWRGGFAAQWLKRWFVQDELVGRVMEIDSNTFSEGGDRLPAMIESGPVREFPANLRIPSVDFDMSVGIGILTEAQVNPAVQVSWSHDGGATWSNPLIRSLGRAGEYSRKVTVRNLGRSTHHGVRLRLEVTEPVPVVLRSAVSTRTSPSRSRQVA